MRFEVSCSPLCLGSASVEQNACSYLQLYAATFKLPRTRGLVSQQGHANRPWEYFLLWWRSNRLLLRLVAAD
eukprot:2038303-Pleurochrysis_carterae.AAC.4